MEPTIVVPKRIKEVAKQAWKEWLDGPPEGLDHVAVFIAQKILENQAQHPPQFSDEQIDDRARRIRASAAPTSTTRAVIAEAFRAAYTAEPELPEAVKQYLWKTRFEYPEISEEAHRSATAHNYEVVEAFKLGRAGLEARSKK